MITTISRMLRHTGLTKSEAVIESTAEQQGLTRSEFLRVMATGAVVTSASGVTGCAWAAGRSDIEPVTEVEDIYDAWESRLNTGDIDGLADLYMPDVVYVNPDGKRMVGRAAVREDLAGLIALNPTIDIYDRQHLVYRDIVFTTNHSRLKITTPDGKTQELTGSGLEILQKQADGGWRYIIDDASRSAS